MKRILLALALVGSLTACVHNPPILVAQSAVATSASLDRLSAAGKQLETAAIITPQVALSFQQKLLSANDKLKPLPEILRTVDRLQVAGSSTASDVDKAIAILQIVGQDISVVVQGVPLSDATAAMIDLVRAAQKTVQDILIEVAQIRGRAQ